jgi:hypothetical protein
MYHIETMPMGLLLEGEREIHRRWSRTPHEVANQPATAFSVVRQEFASTGSED